MTTDELQIGIEEEYQIVSRQTGRLQPKCKRVMQQIRAKERVEHIEIDAEIQHELHLTQIEMASSVCKTLDDVDAQVRKVRKLLIDGCHGAGCDLVAAGTHPMEVPEDADITPKKRYTAMTQQYQAIARDLLIFGCHVHVSMADRQLGLQVMNRVRPWIPIMQAFSANSPYWDGESTGYESYRRELWVQWPMAGIAETFEDLKHFQSCVDELAAVGAINDETNLYWDVRLPTKVPTIEFRAADVMTRVDDAVAYAGLVRALVAQTVADIESGDPMPTVRSETLRYAMWQAARFGMTGPSIDPVARQKVSAIDRIGQLVDHVAGPLRAYGDHERVVAAVNQITGGQTMPAMQRDAGRSGLKAVVDRLTELTAA